MRQNLTFSKKEPYWIKGHSSNWVSMGHCLLIYFPTPQGIAYRCDSFELHETKKPHNPDEILFPYEVQVEKLTPKKGCLGFLFPTRSVETLIVQASSGEHAKQQIAQRGIGMVGLARPARGDTR